MRPGRLALLLFIVFLVFPPSFAQNDVSSVVAPVKVTTEATVNPSPIMTPSINPLTLAASYTVFLGGLGGVSATILTFILTISREKRRAVHSLAVLSLILVTITSFIGVHEMIEINAMVYPGLTPTKRNPYYPSAPTLVLENLEFYEGSHVPMERLTLKSARNGSVMRSSQKATIPITADPAYATRHFMVASICIYLSAYLFLFALAVLPYSYISEMAPYMLWIGPFVFWLVVVASSFWVFRTFNTYWNHDWGTYEFCLVVALSLLLGCLAGLPKDSELNETKKAPPFPFLLFAVYMSASLGYYALSWDDAFWPSEFDVLFFVGTVMSTPAMLGGLLFRVASLRSVTGSNPPSPPGITQSNTDDSKGGAPRIPKAHQSGKPESTNNDEDSTRQESKAPPQSDITLVPTPPEVLHGGMGNAQTSGPNEVSLPHSPMPTVATETRSRGLEYTILTPDIVEMYRRGERPPSLPIFTQRNAQDLANQSGQEVVYRTKKGDQKSVMPRRTRLETRASGPT